ncbi:MAG: hypothetical protein K0S38_1090, partial [Candidatus Paceibacter sp.]|nr:hypothetical protein [Candidatus Paceibacter sp.]
MKNNHRGFSTVLVIVALVAIIAIGGFVMYASYSQNTPNTDQTANQNPSESQTGNQSTSTPTQSGTVSQVKNFYIAIGDKGAIGKEIGCEDSVVPVTVNITPTAAPLRPALEKLLANKNRDYGESGFMNALY